MNPAQTSISQPINTGSTARRDASITVCAGRYTLIVCRGRIPADHDDYASNAALVESFDPDADDGEPFFLACYRMDEQLPGKTLYALVLTLRFNSDDGFKPGLLIVDETDRLFVGANEQTLAYDLASSQRLWQTTTTAGFWGWGRHADCVVMRAETEMTVYDLHANPLWSLAVEPPWGYDVDGDAIDVEVGGVRQRFFLSDGTPV